MRSLAILLIALTPMFAWAQDYPSTDSRFSTWLLDLREEARGQGIRSSTLDAALSDIQPLDDVIMLDRRQPENTMTLQQYLKRVVTKGKIEKGRRLYREHYALLKRIADTYGVQPQYIVALWGIESNYGGNTGNYRVVEALATLAYDGRRSAFFRGELLKALTILDEGHIAPENMLGSWAGAMGQCQFMPSSFLRYAVDNSGDGHKDIWNTEADVFASIANYLAKEGWQAGKGVNGGKKPSHNFNVLLKWNRSRYFATAVGQLATAIVKSK